MTPNRGLSALALALAVAACSGGTRGARPQAAPSPTPATLSLPSEVLGLRIVPENIAPNIQELRGLYLDQVGLFSLRQGEILRATLQASQFNRLARPEDRSFRARIVAQLGSTVPKPLRVGSHTVYLSSGQQQLVFLWFHDRWMYVLTVRSDYRFPRTLLRRLLEVTTHTP